MNFYNDIDPSACAWSAELIKQKLVPNGVVDGRSIKDIKSGEISKYNQCHFFSGILGWPYALRLAGWPEQIPVWTGSCPCQPYSVAGNQRGDADERNLWPEFFRLIRECRPEFVFGEQVASAIRHGWLDGISADLEAEGYTVGACVLGAHSVGAPHIRQRLYWVAHAEGERESPITGGSREGIFQPNGCSTVGGLEFANSNRRATRLPSSSIKRHGDSVGSDGSASGLGNSNGSRSETRLSESAQRQERDARESNNSGDQFNHWSSCDIIPCRDGKFRRIPAGSESSESGIRPVVDGFPSVVDGVRNHGLSLHPLTAAKVEGRAALLKGAGNAIVPQVAAAFVRAFMDSIWE